MSSPVVPAATAPVSVTKMQADGLYYGSVTESGAPVAGGTSVGFELVQLFTGAACIGHFGVTDEDACVNDYGVETNPTATVEVSLGGQFISVVDAATQQSYRVSGAELYELLIGGVPSAGAPIDYVYSGFGYLITVEAGAITRLEQWWTP